MKILLLAGVAVLSLLAAATSKLPPVSEGDAVWLAAASVPIHSPR